MMFYMSNSVSRSEKTKEDSIEAQRNGQHEFNTGTTPHYAIEAHDSSTSYYKTMGTLVLTGKKG